MEVQFFKAISTGNANFSELPHTLNKYGGNINVSFVLSSKGTLVCITHPLVYSTDSPCLLHTFVVDTLLNFPMPFNIILLTPTHPA